MAIISARNTRLAVVAKDKPLTAGFESDVIDFKEMSNGSIQVVRAGGDANDGTFKLLISNLCDRATFATYPDGEITCTGVNLMWLFKEIPFRFAIVVYTPGTDATGTADVYARGKNP